MNERTPPYHGWREFFCEESNRRYTWPTRDRFSPSSENCPVCFDAIYPRGSFPDQNIPLDSQGEVKLPWSMEYEEYLLQNTVKNV